VACSLLARDVQSNGLGRLYALHDIPLCKDICMLLSIRAMHDDAADENAQTACRTADKDEVTNKQVQIPSDIALWKQKNDV
jgi:hypothetical protein